MPKHLASPFSTGGGGVGFEQLVAAYYLASLLVMEIPRGLDCGIAHAVRLQTGYRGDDVDDITVVSVDKCNRHELFLQAKHRLTFSNNELFVEVLQACWKHFSTETFHRDFDCVGVAVGYYPQTLHESVQPLTKVAQTSLNEAEFDRKLSSGAFSKETSALYSLFRSILETQGGYSSASLWSFIRRFVVLHFDLENQGSRDAVAAWNKLLNVTKNRDPEQARILFALLTDMAREYAKAAGTIDLHAITKRLPSNLMLSWPASLHDSLKELRELLAIQWTTQVQRQKNSRKYIPQLYASVDSAKIQGRFFVTPTLCWKKVIEQIGNFSPLILNSFLALKGAPRVEFPFPELPTEVKFPDLSAKCEQLRTLIKNHACILNDIIKLEKQSCGTLMEDAVSYRVSGAARTLLDQLEGIVRLLDLIQARVFFLVDKAGQGKTNFVCDLIENVIGKRNGICVFLSGNDFGSGALDQLGEALMRKVYGESGFPTVNDFFNSISMISAETDSPFVIVIDGLNENTDVVRFSQGLEAFIEWTGRLGCIKFVLTCRTDYFDQRFNNLCRSSFSDRSIFIRHFSTGMTESKRKRMYRRYLDFFDIKVISLANHVYETLTRDPLLFRFFCEAYAGKDGRTTVIAQLHDILKESLFRKYLDTKMEEMDRKSAENGIISKARFSLRNFLKEMITYMISERVFADIPLERVVSSNRFDEVTRFIDADILFRRELADPKASLFSDHEVVSFTFDEFRDFVLAEYLLRDVYAKEPKRFEEILEWITNPSVPVSEGVSRYLFYGSRRLQNGALCKVIGRHKWYDGIFLDCVFQMEDQLITDDDLQDIKKWFLRGIRWSSFITLSCLRRLDTEVFPVLNVGLFLEVTGRLNQSEFEDLVSPVFIDGLERSIPLRRDHIRIDLDQMIESVVALFEQKPFPKRAHKVFEVLLILQGLPNLFTRYRIQDLCERYAKEYPDNALEQLSAYSATANPAINERVGRLLRKLFERS